MSKEQEAKVILFSPIGGTDPIKYDRDGSMLHICRVYKPDIVYLYLSHEMLQKHRKENCYVRVLELLGETLQHTFEIRVIERDNLVDVQQYDVFYEDFRGIVQKIEADMGKEDRLLINMSSGTPAMKSALLVMATLAEYRFLPIQVSTPLKQANSKYEERDGISVDLFWDFNQDNDDFKNRCEEVRCFNLIKLLKIDMIKKHILAYDYAAAKTISAEIQEDISAESYQLLRMAYERERLNGSAVSKIMKQLPYDLFPIKEGNKQKIFEYILVLGIKIAKEEYADFVRAITPVVVDLLEEILKLKAKIKVKEYCYWNKEGVLCWDREKLANTELLRVFEQAYSEFKYGPVYSNALKVLIENFVLDPVLVSNVQKMIEVEKHARNIAAHEIVSVSDEWFRKTTGHSTKDILAIIQYLANAMGIRASEADWKIYDTMNQVIIDTLK